MINQVTMRLIEAMDFNADGSGQSRYKHRQLLLLDEFPSLGKLDIFQEALVFIAGYGLKALTRSRQPRSSPRCVVRPPSSTPSASIPVTGWRWCCNVNTIEQIVQARC